MERKTPSLIELQFETKGEGFYDITNQVTENFTPLLKDANSGVLFLFIKHTSAGLLVNESYDPSAAKDMENFLKHIAPRNLSFIQHTTEGPDDSPSHMKSMLIHQNLCFPVESKELVLGTWQGIFLAEFRDQPKRRNITIKFLPDRY